jgi:hypothetical protein
MISSLILDLLALSGFESFLAFAWLALAALLYVLGFVDIDAFEAEDSAGD